MYYRNANCAVVVYDITQSTSLEKAKSWIRELQRQADPNIVIALCGNKLDLAARRQVSQEEAKKYADEEGLMWGETSAKSGEGVADIFTSILDSRREGNPLYKSRAVSAVVSSFPDVSTPSIEPKDSMVRLRLPRAAAARACQRMLQLRLSRNISKKVG